MWDFFVGGAFAGEGNCTEGEDRAILVGGRRGCCDTHSDTIFSVCVSQAYLDELLLQLRHFDAALQIFGSRPSKPATELAALSTFLSHVTPCYSKELKEFPSRLVGLLEVHNAVMDPVLRKSLAEDVIMLRNRKLLPVVGVNQLFFQMFRCHDKKLRSLLSGHIVTDVKNMNQGKQNNKANRELQNFMFKMLEDRNGVAAKCSLDVLVKLYRKKIWDDAKTVNVIATACFSPEAKVRATALNFFLGLDDEQSKNEGKGDDSDAEGEESLLDATDLQKMAGNVDKKTGQAKTHSKRSRKRMLQARRSLNKVTKKNDKQPGPHVRFAALQLLNDPQGFTEKLLAQLRRSTDKFEVKLLMISLISRIIATHELLVLNFYPFVQKYMQPHQMKVTSILASAAQACHPLVPPDAIEPLIKTLANHFIVDGRQDEVIAIGLNTVREICSRQPLAMDKTLLEDLVQYKKHKDKGVVMAARSLISLFRQVDSELLAKKDRGKLSDEVKAKRREAFGREVVAGGVEGLDLLDLPTDSDEDSDTEEEEGESDGESARRDRRKLRLGFDDQGEEDEEEEESGEEMEEDEESGEEEEESDEENPADRVFEKGDRVEGKWKGSSEYHPGVVVAKGEGDGTYHIKFDDGDVDKAQPVTDMRPYQSDSEEDEESGEEDEEGGGDGGKGEDVEMGDEDEGKAKKEEDDLTRLDASRPLTAEEFAKIRKLKLKKQVESAMGKRKATSAVVELGGGGRLAADDLIGQHKKRRMEKLERIQSVMKGREEREGAWKDRHDKKKLAGGTRNDEKAKNKPYLMVRNSRQVRAKLKVGVAEKNKASSKAANRKQFRGRMGGEKN